MSLPRADCRCARWTPSSPRREKAWWAIVTFTRRGSARDSIATDHPRSSAAQRPRVRPRDLSGHTDGPSHLSRGGATVGGRRPAGCWPRASARAARVGLFFANGVDWVIWWLAASRIGAVAVPLSTLYAPAEIAKVVRLADVGLLIAPTTRAQHRCRRAIRSGAAGADRPTDRPALAACGAVPASHRAHRRLGPALGNASRRVRSRGAAGHSGGGRGRGLPRGSGRHGAHVGVDGGPERRAAHPRHAGPADVDMAGRDPCGHWLGRSRPDSVRHAVLLDRRAARDDGRASRARHAPRHAPTRRRRPRWI